MQVGSEYKIRFIDAGIADVLFPTHISDTVIRTAEPASSVHGSHVMKEADLSCAVTTQVPMFISVGDRVRNDTTTRKDIGREASH